MRRPLAAADAMVDKVASPHSGRGGQKHRADMEGQLQFIVAARRGVRIGRGLSGEKSKKQLLNGIALLMPFEKELHRMLLTASRMK